MREILRTFSTMLNEKRHPLAEWVQLVPVAQWALNAAYRERYLILVYGHEPGTPFATLAAIMEDDRMVETLDPARV